MTTTSVRHGRRFAVLVVAVGALSLALPAVAHAAISSQASATVPVSSAKWAATASSSSVAFLTLADNSRSGIVSVTNTGTVPLTGFTLNFSGTSGATGELTVTSCTGSWAESGNGNNKTHTCSGSTSNLGTASGGSRAVSHSLAAGATVNLRLTGAGEKQSGNSGGSTSVSVRVPRSSARAAQARS